MTYVSVCTLVVYLLLIGLLVAVSVIDIRHREIPNVFVAVMAGLWIAWRVFLGVSGEYMGVGFAPSFMGVAPTLHVPPGLRITGISTAESLVGAIVLGGGLLVLTTIYEALSHKNSFGGGDIKLMCMLGLFLGLYRGMICLFVACLLSVVYAIVCSFIYKGRKSIALDTGEIPLPRRATFAEEEKHLHTQERVSSIGAITIPFAPFMTVGTVVAFVA